MTDKLIREFEEMLRKRESFLAELAEDEASCLHERIERQYQQEECYNIRRTPEYLALIDSINKVDECVNKDYHLGYEIRGVGTFEPCRDCNNNWVMCDRSKSVEKEDKPDKCTLEKFAEFRGDNLDMATPSEVIGIISEYLEENLTAI